MFKFCTAFALNLYDDDILLLMLCLPVPIAKKKSKNIFCFLRKFYLELIISGTGKHKNRRPIILLEECKNELLKILFSEN